MAVAGIIRQQACGLRVWCPEEEEEEAAPRSHGGWYLARVFPPVSHYQTEQGFQVQVE